MEATNSLDEERIRSLLLGGRREVAEALEEISAQLRDGICGWLRRSFPALSAEDLADVWQDTLLAVITALRRNRFDADRPLVPWLSAIASRRAIDLARRRSSHARALDVLGRELSRTAVGRRWALLGAAERREILDLLAAEIAGLPPRQRLVLRTFSLHYPETADMEVLRKRVSAALGEEATIASVKRALQEGRRKLRELFERKGYRVP